MDLKSKSKVIFRILLIFISLLSAVVTNGQQTPLNPISYWVFVPYIYNPAIVGSKDFLSIGFNAAFQGESNTQLLSGNTRITKTTPGYFSSPDITEYTNVGIGGSIFRDIDGLSENMGISGSFSYQIPLNSHRLSFLSLGTSVKGAYSTITSDSADLENPTRKNTYPNFDLGIYYYGPGFYSGISAVNLLGSPWIPDTLGNYDVPVSRQYFFTAGFKILISKSLNMVLEPSVLVAATDSTFDQISDNISPVFKLYVENFCLGTSFSTGSEGKVSFFGQFRYPRLYVGVYYELANKTAYYKSKPTVEFTLGINIYSDKSNQPKRSRW